MGKKSGGSNSNSKMSGRAASRLRYRTEGRRDRNAARRLVRHIRKAKNPGWALWDLMHEKCKCKVDAEVASACKKLGIEPIDPVERPKRPKRRPKTPYIEHVPADNSVAEDVLEIFNHAQ